MLCLCCECYHGNSTGLRDYNVSACACVCYHRNSTGLRGLQCCAYAVCVTFAFSSSTSSRRDSH